MANFCDFEFRVTGKKKAVKVFYESTPYLDWKDVEYEDGTDSNYEMHFKGNCKWSINFDVEDDCDGVTVDLSKYSMSQIEELGAECVGYSVRAKSEMFQCEVKVHYWSMESEFDQFDHYKNGECLKKRKIAFDNYGEEENFDWDTLEFIGHEGEYDESVDGEQSDIDFMNMMSMIPGVTVPSQKPKKKANSSFHTVSSPSNKVTESGSIGSSTSATKYYNGVSITYDKGKKVKGEGYTFLVPDSFSIGEEEDRDFVAWYPSKDDPEEHSSGIIRIYPGQAQKTIEEGLVLETLQSYPPMCSAFQEHGIEVLRTQNTPISALMRNCVHYPIDAKHTGGGCMFNRTPNYYTYIVTLFINDHFKQFRFDVEGANTRSEAQIKKTLLALIDGIIPDVPFALEKPLNDQFYKDQKLTKKFVKNWSQKFDLQLGRQRAVMDIRLKTVEAMVQSQSMNGGVDRDEIIERIRNTAREMADVTERLLKESAELIEYFSSVDGENMALLDLYNEVAPCCESMSEVSINIGDDDKVVEKISSLATLKKRFLTSQVSKLKERSDSVKYEEACQKIDLCQTVEDIEKVEKILSELGTYRDSVELKEKCINKKLEMQNAETYKEAVCQMEQAKTSAAMKKVVDAFNKLGDYKDSKDLCAKSTEQMERLVDEENKRKEEKRLQEEKLKEEKHKMFAALDNVAERFCVNEDGFAILTLDGRVKTYNCPPQMTEALSKWKNIKSIRLKISYKFDTFIAVGLKYNGTVVSFSQYSNAESEFNTSTWTDIVQIDVGYMHAIGLKRDGTVVATGNNSWDRCSVDSWKGMKKVVASTCGTIGLQKNGQIKIVGIDEGTKFSCKNVVDIATATFVYALTEDGNLYKASSYDRQARSNKDWGEIAYISKNQSAVKCCTAITKKLKLRTEATNYDKVISKWNNIVGGGLWSDGVIGITADGYLKFEAPGKVIPDDIKNERLFYNFMTIEDDHKKAIEEAERKRVEEIKAEIADLEKQMIEAKGLFAGMKKKSLQNKIDVLKAKI